MRNMLHEISVKGKLYSHNLEKKVSQKGIEYISGRISILTEKEGNNTVDIYYRYVTAEFASGKPNKTYQFFEEIIENPSCTVMGSNFDEAYNVSTSGVMFNVNEYYDESGQLKSTLRYEGGFVNKLKNPIDFDNPKEKKNSFKVSMIIGNVFEYPTDVDQIPKTEFKGYVFGYKNALIPVSFVAYGKQAQDYWMAKDISPNSPILIDIWGKSINTVFKQEIITENAFGEDLVEEKVSYKKEFIINGGSPEEGAWDSPDTILVSEFQTLLKNRELYLAEIKANGDAYREAKKNASASTTKAAPTMNISNDDFNF